MSVKKDIQEEGPKKVSSFCSQCDKALVDGEPLKPFCSKECVEKWFEVRSYWPGDRKAKLECLKKEADLLLESLIKTLKELRDA